MNGSIRLGPATFCVRVSLPEQAHSNILRIGTDALEEITKYPIKETT
jgi:hypothetical protein